MMSRVLGQMKAVVKSSCSFSKKRTTTVLQGSKHLHVIGDHNHLNYYLLDGDEVMGDARCGKGRAVVHATRCNCKHVITALHEHACKHARGSRSLEPVKPNGLLLTGGGIHNRAVQAILHHGAQHAFSQHLASNQAPSAPARSTQRDWSTSNCPSSCWTPHIFLGHAADHCKLCEGAKKPLLSCVRWCT